MCREYHKIYACGCRFNDWEFCSPPTRHMRPSKWDRHGQGCGNPDSHASKRKVNFDHCCRLSCCLRRLQPLTEKVRNTDKEAGLDVGAREGLDYDPDAAMYNLGIRQETLDRLKAQQGIVLEALKSHLNVCAAVIWPGEEQTMGIVKPIRQDLQIQPLSDIDQAELRSKILIEFRHENRLRRLRNKISEEQLLFDPVTGCRHIQIPETKDENFKQQNTELMRILEKLDAELSSPNASRRVGSPSGLRRTASDLSVLSQGSGFFKGFELDSEPMEPGAAAEALSAYKLFRFQPPYGRYRTPSPAVQSEPETFQLEVPQPEIPQPETEEERFARMWKEREDHEKKWARFLKPESPDTGEEEEEEVVIE